LVFSSIHLVWLEGRLIIPFPHARCAKLPFVIILKIGGLLHLFARFPVSRY
jgi:hypothetical protein